MTFLFLGRDAFLNSSLALTGIGLIIPALLWLYFGEKNPSRNTTSTLLLWLILIPLALIIAPGTSFLIQRSLGSVDLKESLIVVPSALLTVYAFLRVTKRFHISDSPCSGSFSASKSRKWLGAVLCLAVLISTSICIPMRISYSPGFEFVSNPEKISPEVLELCEILGSDPVLLPDEVLGQIGEFNNEVNPVHVSDPLYNETDMWQVTRQAIDAGDVPFVIRKAYVNAKSQKAFKARRYQKTAETDHYVIYRRF